MSTQFNRPLRLTHCAAAVALALSSVAAAQDVGQEGSVDEVTVTGSRIRQSGFTTPTPVTAVSADELELMAPGNLVESVSQLPIFFNNTTQDAPGAFFNGPGSGSLNVRGIGTNRTLTLLNGRRMPASNKVGSVDVNAFPEVLVERVEIVTGGASAAYGTDAVAGVANFILNTNFDGFEAHVQGGGTEARSRGTSEAGAVFGTSVGERGHVLASVEMFEQDGIYGYTDYDWYNSWGLVRTPAPGAPLLDSVQPNVVSTNSTTNGLIGAPGSALNRLEFLRDGSVRPFVLGSPAIVGGGTQSHSITNGGSGTQNFNEYATVTPEAERQSGFFYYDFDVSDSLNLYTQLLYGRNENRTSNNGGIFQGTTVLTIHSGNPFLPSSVQQIMNNEGRASFQFNRLGGLEDLAAGAAQETENTARSFTVGFDKELSADGMLDGWQLHGYVQAGRTEHRGRHINGIRLDRIVAAVDVVNDANGRPVCYAATVDPANWSDCVPLNLFGAGNASPQALDYVIGLDAGTRVQTPVYFTDSGYSNGRTLDYYSGADKLTLADVEQDLIEFSLDGNIAEGWAGPISAAFGLHYREESILQLTFDHTNPSGAFDSRPALFNPAVVRGIPSGISARTTAIQFASVPNIDGGFEVKEAFAEFNIPLVVDKPVFQQLNATLASRWAEYSGSGSIQAWKGGLDWQVNDLLRVRTTVSRDVRAATLAERYDRTGGTTRIEDPLLGQTRDASLASGGNPTLRPEEADTRTIGMVFQPAAWSGFQASIDWYDIEIAGAVGQLGVQNIVNECFAFPTSSACNQITRDPSAGNAIVLVEDVFVNINAANVSGLDLELAYRTDVGPGSLGWRFLATKLNENSTTNLGSAKIDRAGEVGIQDYPEVKFTTNLNYNQGPFSVFAQLRYFDSGLLDATKVVGLTIDNNNVDSVLYTDLRLGYGKDRANGSRWEVFGNIQNLFDQEPPVAASFSTFTATAGQVNTSMYDLLGRRYTIGFNYQL